MSYDANKDELYLSDTGYWAANAWITTPGLVQDQWGASVVFPYIGGWSDGVALNSGDAYLDNFVVDSGTEVCGTVIPAPGALVLVSIGTGLVGWLAGWVVGGVFRWRWRWPDRFGLPPPACGLCLPRDCLPLRSIVLYCHFSVATEIFWWHLTIG